MNILLIITILLGIGRFFITPRLNLPTVEGLYETTAHLFVGGLFGAWFAGYKLRKIFPLETRIMFGTINDWLFMAIGLSLLELIMFLLQKFVL